MYFVRDNGVGIDEPQKQKLFQAFYKVNQAKSRGEGMGLAIVHRVIDRHGGRVWVDSKPGAGTTFFFTVASEPPTGVGPGILSPSLP